MGLKPRPFRTALHWMGGGLVPLFLLATALNILTTFDVLYSHERLDSYRLVLFTCTHSKWLGARVYISLRR